MIPPFHLAGSAGHPLDAASRPFRPLDGSASLTLRSLGADELSFHMRPAGSMPVPATDQPVSLADDTAATVFRGYVTARRWIHAARAWQITATGPYQALAETDLLAADGRPYLSYPAQDWRLTVADILARAAAAGVPIQAPPALPAAWAMPKMAFKSAKLAEALERLAAMLPDLATRMDYSTVHPTLRFFTRTDSAPILLDLDAAGHGIADPDLEENPADRALAISFAYSRRNGDSVLLNLIQSAGDDAAEARRKVSVFLSGAERTDMFVTESLTTAQNAVATATAAVDAVGASIAAAAASAQITITWANILARDTNLAAAVAAQSGFAMTPASFSVTLYTSIGCGGGSAWTTTASMSKSGPALYTSGGSPATGWYPIVTGAFTAPELATAGATLETRYIRGWLYRDNTGGSAGFTSLPAGLKATLTGYDTGYVADCGTTASHYRQYGWYYCDIAVDAINMAPSAVAAAVAAAAGSGSSSLIERAEFVEAPEGLAAFWFARQDWPHFRGSLQVMPRRRHLPLPGDFISIAGDGTPEEWATMRNPVAQCSLDLRDGRATVQIGPPARLDVGSILDRLWVPPADNYQAG